MKRNAPNLTIVSRASKRQRSDSLETHPGSDSDAYVDAERPGWDEEAEWSLTYDDSDAYVDAQRPGWDEESEWSLTYDDSEEAEWRAAIVRAFLEDLISKV